ncbi:MAG: hypothetical protein AB7S26_21300 [Sandaracinaceae bacterium]
MVKRRTFLSAAAAAAAGSLSLPTWMSRAFAQEDDGRDHADELRVLSDAYRTAQRTGRPLLVLVVPADGGRRWERAHAFGEVLNNGSDEVFADLALAEVVCSTMDSLRRLVPQAPEGEPWLIVVEPDEVPARVRAFAPELPSWPDHWTEAGAADFEQRTEQAVDRRISILTEVIHQGLAEDDAMLAHRAEVAQRQLDAGIRDRLQAALRHGSVSAELMRAAPAAVAQAAHRTPGRRSLLHDLAMQARERLTQNRVPGSYWASSWGCGIEVEGRDDNAVVGCGMGHVPERSRRFLYWYSGPAY